MHDDPANLAIGDRAPSCYGVSPGRRFYSFEEQYGRPALLLLIGAEAGAATQPVVEALLACAEAFAAQNADVYLIVNDNPAAVLGPQPGIRAIDCGDFLARCGVRRHQGLLLLLDRNLRIAMRSSPSLEHVRACLDCLQALPQEVSRAVAMPAPAIVLPNLIAPALCRQLIALFESSPTIDGEVARIDAKGQVCSVVDHAKKHRRDMMIEPGTALHQHLKQALLDRCAPEIARAFQARVTHIDRILLSRYDDSGGWFRRHRDNVADNVAFREFALSLNLNTGAYQGGDLMFPEYNDHRHAPPAGGGIVFSASVLHEAAPVTQGSRYVLLTFFHGEAAEARRLAHDAAARPGLGKDRGEAGRAALPNAVTPAFA